MHLNVAIGVLMLAGVGAAIMHPKKPAPKPAESVPEKPGGIIKDADKLVNEARATLKAFNDGGLSVTLAKPPKTTPRPDVGGLPRPRDAVVCPTGGCVVTPLPPSASARQANVAGSGGACRVGAIRRLFGRRGG